MHEGALGTSITGGCGHGPTHRGPWPTVDGGDDARWAWPAGRPAGDDDRAHVRCCVVWNLEVSMSL